MTRSFFAFVTFSVASAALARPAEACAMYIPPPTVEVTIGEPVRREAPVADANAPAAPGDETQLQQMMALIDAVGLIPEVAAAAPAPAEARGLAEARGVAKTSPPMAVAPIR